MGFPPRQDGWIFYNPTKNRKVLDVSRDAFFKESFSSPQYLSKLPFKRGILLQNPSEPNVTFIDTHTREHMGDAMTQLTHDLDMSLQQFNVDEDLENTPNDTAKNMGGIMTMGILTKAKKTARLMKMKLKKITIKTPIIPLIRSITHTQTMCLAGQRA